jgi:hypothetical protein
MDAYYDADLKKARFAEFANYPIFRFVKLDLAALGNR